MLYTALKFFHLLGVFSWMAALFYVFRLFVYHSENRASELMHEQLSLMEKRLIRMIQLPAMIVTLASAAGMLMLVPGHLRMPWFHLKMLGVVMLLGYHFFAVHTWKKFSAKNFFLTPKQCRFINEVPTLALILIALALVMR